MDIRKQAKKARRLGYTFDELRENLFPEIQDFRFCIGAILTRTDIFLKNNLYGITRFEGEDILEKIRAEMDIFEKFLKNYGDKSSPSKNLTI